jgi:hypothetical protein
MKVVYQLELEKLDRELNLDDVRNVQSQIDCALSFKYVEEYQYYIHYQSPEIWPLYSNRERESDPEKDLMMALGVIKGGTLTGLPVSSRITSELGCWGIIHSLFGGKAAYHENQSKWLEPIPGMTIEKFIDNGIPDVKGGIVERLINRIKSMLDILSEYENLSKVPIYPIDVFGVLETACALLDTSQLITKMMFEPVKVEKFFDVILQTTIKYNIMIEELFRKELASGRIMTFQSPFSDYCEYRIVEDSAILLSPDLYGQFCRKYNEILFEKFAPGGGAVHSCGNGSHLVDEVLKTRGLRHFDPGQIEFYDFHVLYHKLASAQVGMFFRTTDENIDSFQIRDYLKHPGLVMGGFSPPGRTHDICKGLSIIRAR